MTTEDVNELRARAESGNLEACFQYACCLDDGRGVPCEPAAAAALFKHVYNQDPTNAANAVRYARCLRLGRGIEQDIPTSTAILTAADKVKCPSAWVDMGLALKYGRGVSASESEAFKKFKAAADQKYPLGRLYYGLCLEQSFGCTRDLVKAANMYKLAADDGLAMAQHNYALCCLYENRGVPYDPVKAVKYFQLAADQGYVLSQIYLATLLQRGLGTAADPVQAAFYFKKAADQQNLDGMVNYGSCLEHGLGVTKDINEAIRLYKTAAAKQHPLGQNNYGLCFLFGRGLKKDETKAFDWFKKSAEQLCIPGIYNYGRCFELGLGTKVDMKRAAQCYKQAANQGYVPALYGFGKCLENGQGIDRGLKQAAHNYRRAADKGYPGAEEAWNRVMNELNGTSGVVERAARTRIRSKDIGDYIINFDEWEKVREIGVGRLGTVDLLRHKVDGREIAVKTFPATRAIDPRAVKGFSDAIQELVKLVHPCIWSIRGVGLPAAGVGARIATDYAVNGSLLTVLTAVKNRQPPSYWTHQNIAHMIVSIALGMKYLHGKDEIHGGLKPANCMLFEGGLIKLCDFGLIRFYEVGLLKEGQARPGGPPNFQAPDMNEPKFTEKTDVFSFGLIFTELLTGSDFFSRQSQMHVSARAPTEFKPQWKPEFLLPEPMKQLVQRCWHLKPAERPSFTEILDELDRLNFKFWDDVDSLEVREFIADLREQ